MSNGWTGGQYSLLRWLVGAVLAYEFLRLVGRIDFLLAAERLGSAGAGGEGGWVGSLSRAFASPPEAALVPLLALGTLLAVLLAIGWHDRWAAAGLWLLLLVLVSRGPLLAGPGPLAIAVLLALLATLPPRPYGSWAARGRVDPAGDWKVPEWLFGAAWIVVGVGHFLRGLSLLPRLDGASLLDLVDGPLGRAAPWRAWLVDLPPSVWAGAAIVGVVARLCFLPLAPFRRLRPWIWGAVATTLVVEALVLDAAFLDLGALLLHLFLFDPAWIPSRPQPSAGVDQVFYDGHCGLCHRTVRFLLAEDREGSRFRFAPLQGATFEATLGREERERLPDSVIVRTPDGRLLARSGGVLRALCRLGGLWRLAGGAGRWIPRPVRDAAYDGIARVRRRIFGAAEEVCPLLPPELRERFDP